MATRKKITVNQPIQPEPDTVEGSFFGQKIKFAGRETIYLAVTVIALAGAAYLLVALVDGVGKATERQTLRIDMQHAEFSAEHKASTTVQQQMVDALTEQNYIITRTDAERHKMNLEMPATLRKKMKKREDD